MQGLDQAAAPERVPSNGERNPQVLGLRSEDTVANSTHGNTQTMLTDIMILDIMTQNIGPFGLLSLSVTYTSSHPSPCNLLIPRNLVPLILFGLSSYIPLIISFHSTRRQPSPPSSTDSPPLEGVHRECKHSPRVSRVS
jgi:hypothetical protein